MISSIKIEKAGPMDLPEILSLQKIAYLSEAEIHNDYNIPPLLQTLDQLEEEFLAGELIKAVDDVSGKIIGSVRGYHKDKTLYIGKLMVHPDFQNQGIGKKLLNFLENLYQGYRYELFTSSKSIKNIALYQKAGYQSFRREKVKDNLELVFLEK